MGVNLAAVERRPDEEPLAVRGKTPSVLATPPTSPTPVRMPRRSIASGVATVELGNRSDQRREIWLDAYRSVRAETERRAAPLTPEDQVIQSMPDASPAKWHRAHVTWFFETFLLVPHA